MTLDIAALRALAEKATRGVADGQPLIAATGRMHMVGPAVDGADYDAKVAQAKADAALWNAARTALPEALDEIERLRRFIAASKECAKGNYIAHVDNENRRLHATFRRVVAEATAGGKLHFDMSICEWCHEKWPKVDDQTIEETKQKARVHAYSCTAHPMRAEIAALRAALLEACDLAECALPAVPMDMSDELARLSALRAVAGGK
jgi:hypothetical protein